MIYRSDGKPFHGPRKDFQAFNRRKGRMQRIAFGDRFVQIGNWRFADYDGAHFSIASADKFKTAMLFRSDGRPFSGPRVDYQAFDRPIGKPRRITFGAKFIQIGNFRLADIDGKHFSFASRDKKRTAQIMRSDGYVFAGPRRDYQAFNRRSKPFKITFFRGARRAGCRKKPKRRPRRKVRPRRRRRRTASRCCPKGRLLPGCTVALHSRVHNRFVRLNSAAGMDMSPRRAWYKMPKTWRWEWFKVVNAGNGQIALHSKAHNRFARMNKRGFMDASASQFANSLSKKWTRERFTVVSAGNGEIALHNKAQNRYVRMSKMKMDVSPPRPSRFLPTVWTWERFRIVQRGRCKTKRKRKVPKKKRKVPKRKRCPRGCRTSWGQRDDPTVNLRQFIKAGRGDFTVKLVFKLKRRSFTSAAVVFSGGNRVGLDPFYTSRSPGGFGSWRVRRQYRRGPRPTRWHCLVLRRRVGKLSGFLNGRFIFSRPMTDNVWFVDLAAVRNVMWVKDFVLKKGWHAGLSCKPRCGLKLGLLQTSTRNSQELSAPSGDLQWTVNMLSTNAEGDKSYKVVNLMGSSKEGFLLTPPDMKLQEERRRSGLDAEVAAAEAVLGSSKVSALGGSWSLPGEELGSSLNRRRENQVQAQPTAEEKFSFPHHASAGNDGSVHGRLLLRAVRHRSDPLA